LNQGLVNNKLYFTGILFTMKVSKIIVYPIKALRAVELDEVEVTKEGFPHDRRFMLLHVTKDKEGNTVNKNIHVAHYPESVLFTPSLDTAAGTMTVTYKPPQGDSKTIDIPLRPNTNDLSTIEVEMHKSPTKAYQMPQEYNDWFSSCYDKEVILVYLGEHLRPVLMSSSANGQQQQTTSNSATGWLSSIANTAANYLPTSLTSSVPSPGITFADCAPYLIASSRSMDSLQSRLDPSSSDFDILKFRPNIIVSGASEPWEEDFWSQLTIGSKTTIECVHNCGRCKSINIDYETGAPGTGEHGTMLKKMQSDRRVDRGMKYSPIFGRYSFLGEGCEGEIIRVRDEVEVTRRNEENTTFGEFLDSPSFCLRYYTFCNRALVLILNYDADLFSLQIGRVLPLRDVVGEIVQKDTVQPPYHLLPPFIPLLSRRL
jgi:uncharacterized protein YcbX